MALSSLLNQTVTIYLAGNRDKQGRPAYSAGTSARARFERRKTTISTPENEKEPIDGVVFLAPGTTVAVGSKLVYDGANYRVITKSDEVDGRGVTRHLELMVQEWNN